MAAVEVLKKYQYTGPLAISWDDTELEPAISIFQESKNACLIIGSTDGVLRVESQDEIDRVFEQAQLNKASKVSFCTTPMEYFLTELNHDV